MTFFSLLIPPSDISVDSKYNFDCKDLNLECTKKDCANHHDGNKLIMMISILLLLLIIRTIT